MSSNFLQFNPGAANQETDSQYAADAQRTGGFIANQLLPSRLANKILYQVIQFIYAFAQMMAAKGYVMADTDAGALQTVLSNVRTNADERALLSVLPYAATSVFNFANTDAIQMTMSGNVTISTFTGLAPGRKVKLIMIQDGTGGRTLTWPVGPPNLGVIFSAPDPTPGATNIQEIIVLANGTLHPGSPMIVS